jgi:hypothetical protein
MPICNSPVMDQTQWGVDEKNKIQEDEVAAQTSESMHNSIAAGLVGSTSSIQPHYAPTGFPSVYDLAASSLEERQAGEDSIMQDMQTFPDPEGMEVDTPPSEDFWMDIGLEANFVPSALDEQQDGVTHAADDSIRQDSPKFTGFADDERMAHSDCGEDAAWSDHIDDDELSASLHDILLNNSDEETEAKLIEMLKDVDAYNQAHSAAAAPPGEDTHIDTATEEPWRYAVDPFTPEVYKVDLIRCSEPGFSADTDLLEYFPKEYARSIRLLKVKQRWDYTSPSDWQMEVNALIAAIDNKANGLEPWLPLFKWLSLFSRLMEGASASERDKTKKFLLKKLEAMAGRRMEENKASILRLLEARSMKATAGAFFGVQRAIDEDCEGRGSLLLGTIPEFTDELIEGLSERWSWVD